ncbi:hypothetical protein RJ640_015021 [Escallonia rubra]|uniref:Uncharacterized protein n=1 Tax=Escallonia rubra TaxID=112253 RepID=A0AA88U7V7_9ASTE|nr:hypothetical protein RJ640_015021 [Escallonia rubra]
MGFRSKGAFAGSWIFFTSQLLGWWKIVNGQPSQLQLILYVREVAPPRVSFTVRSLSHEARQAFLSALVSDGRAEWMDKSHRKCLILWHRVQDWAYLILHFVKLHGMDRTVLMRALKLLEHKGKLVIFKGNFGRR